MSDPWRRLYCTACHDTISVFEFVIGLSGERKHHQFIDVRLFVCGRCMAPVRSLQLEMGLGLEERTEDREYDPAITQIPF